MKETTDVFFVFRFPDSVPETIHVRNIMLTNVQRNCNTYLYASVPFVLVHTLLSFHFFTNNTFYLLMKILKKHLNTHVYNSYNILYIDKQTMINELDF